MGLCSGVKPRFLILSCFMTDYLCIFFMIHMADQVIRYHSLRIADRDFDPVLYELDNISGEIRCKERKGEFPDQFDEFMLPGLRRQCDEIDYCFYHLDGKAATIHLDSILSLDKLKCLQWTPGDGQPDGGDERWFPIYEKVRAAGRGLWIYFKDGSIREAVAAADRLVHHLGPEGLYLHFLYDLSETEGRELIRHAERHWNCSC